MIAMKQFGIFMMTLALLGLGISSCDNDEGGSVAINISADKTSVSGTEGEGVTVTITWNASGGVKSIVPDVDYATIPGSIDGSFGTFQSTITLPADDGSVSYTITDIYDATASVKVDFMVGVMVITDDDLVANLTYNWTADKEYLLDGLVYLEDGGTLNIEAGTVIKAKATPSNSNDNASALIIARGATINAEGTASNPIIFTSELDDLEGITLAKEDNGQWGGLLVLGKAPVYKKGNTEVQIEGIPSNEARGLYGGNEADDNSGILKYVSIRFTGIGFAPGDELQGLTLGGVGSGTTIEYIDIYSSADDGIEVFGGTVNLRYISVAFSTDDDFDFDLGYRGNAQFLFSIMRSDDEGYDHGGEWDGASPDDAPLYSMPQVFNLTTIGPGQSATGRDKVFLMREHYTGILGNSVIVDFPGKGLEVQDLGCNASVDSYSELDDELFIKNNTWSAIGSATTVNDLIKITSKDGSDNPITPCDPDGATLAAHLTAYNNLVETASVVVSVSRERDGGLDPATVSKLGEVADYPNAWFEAVDYRGAFDPNGSNWLAGWSTLSKYGYLSE